MNSKELNLNTEKIESNVVMQMIIAYYGNTKQTIKCIEELSELQKELCKALIRKTDIDHIEEEVADVVIMLEQIIFIYNLKFDEIEEIIKKKLERTLKRIIAVNSYNKSNEEE